MSAQDYDVEKKAEATTVAPVDDSPGTYEDSSSVGRPVVAEINPLKRDLQGRHMQMIAMGGAIGAGLFVGTGSALQSGGPGALLIGYLIVGVMLLLTVQALAELAVMYPVNGAFFEYCVRFIDPAWGFAVGWDYALGWLVILPFEITAASITIEYWNPPVNIGVFIAVFLVALSLIQIFGVRGYGEVEFVLSLMKITAIIGFIILGIVIDLGGAPKGGYIGTKYWRDPGAFTDFPGFCSVFVTAAFAFGGTELSGLAAAEAKNPAKAIPRATKQVFLRIMLFYVLATFIVGLIVPSSAKYLIGSSGANTKASPFVVSIQNAGIGGLPSVMNAVITISVLSVANSATFGSSRTLQALAANGMAPKWMAYVDKAGRPVSAILLQIAFGFLAFINEAAGTGETIFYWLLALSGISNFVVWGSICLAHARFRSAWKHHGHDVGELAYAAPFGAAGSYVALGINCICLIALFYESVAPMSVIVFFENYLALPICIAFFAIWKIYCVFSKDPARSQHGRRLFLRVQDMDVLSDMREGALDVDLPPRVEYATWGEWFKAAPMRVVRSIF